jgi:hypothetical protein
MSTQPDRVSGDAASFIGNIPEHYDTGLGPVIFVDYAADIARRTAACGPAAIARFSTSRRASHSD